MILHHYQMSPFSEKVRAMFGYTNMSWESAISPAMPPRAIVDPLVGGYRKIPIGQIGADFFCDTQLITSEIASQLNQPSLALAGATEQARNFANQADSAVFMAMVASPSAAKMLRVLFTSFMPWTAVRFIKDRAKISREIGAQMKSGRKPKDTLKLFFTEMECRLGETEFIFGAEPCIADFSSYHVLWFGCNIHGPAFLDEFENTKAWFERIKAFGHGKQTELSKKEVFRIAKDNEPRAIQSHDDPLVGKTVSIGPADYGLDKVQGTLVGKDDLRWIIRRDTNRFGALHIHFPKQGFVLDVD